MSELATTVMDTTPVDLARAAAARIQPGEGSEPQEDEPTRIIEPQGQEEAGIQERP